MALMAGRMLSRADLDALPDDGLRHELIDGSFVMTPAPGMAHQDFAFALARALHAATEGTDLKVVMAPYDVAIGAHVVEPDIVVAPRVAFTERDLQMTPLLVVEVRSPSTAWLDEGRKRSIYQEGGSPTTGSPTRPSHRSRFSSWLTAGTSKPSSRATMRF